jgi:HD superfamily phosphodiesterase
MRKLIQQYAKDLTAGRLASGYEHSYRVYGLARSIGEGLEYDDEVLHAACFLHDTEMASGHPVSSAERARAILEETGFAPGRIVQVHAAIRHHMPGEPSEEYSLETKLLHDANLLDSLGAIGFARLCIGAFFWHHLKTMEEVLEFLRRWRSHAEHFYFQRTREMAREKLEFFDQALDQLARECSPSGADAVGSSGADAVGSSGADAVGSSGADPQEPAHRSP